MVQALPKLHKQHRINRFLKALGPGLITGAADDDPSGIATYSIAGASLGFATLWTALVTLPLMFVFGLWLEGRLFPFELTQPLVALAAFADIGLGVPYFIAKAMGAGAGRVIAQTFEYGNAFLIVAGLLNMLVVLDAFDVAQGRK